MVSLESFIEFSTSAATIDELVTTFRIARSRLGFEYLAYGSMGVSLNSGGQLAQVAPLIVEYPGEWLERYNSQGYGQHDPVVQRGIGRRRAFEWNDFQFLSREEQQVIAEARDAGLNGGLSVPIYEPGAAFIVSFSGRAPMAHDRQIQAKATLLAHQFHSVYTAINTSPLDEGRPILTDREREMLLWCARGKSAWEIGQICNVSEHTVRFHLKNAGQKLDSTSRTLTVVKAIRMGLIDP